VSTTDEEIHNLTERLFWPNVKPDGSMLYGDVFRNRRNGIAYEIRQKHGEEVEVYDLHNQRRHLMRIAGLQELFERGNLVWI
jgi:hypothetical protein